MTEPHLNGTASKCGRHSGWGRLDINREDPVELSIAADLQKVAISHVVGSSCKAYTCQWNLFVAWCGAPEVPITLLGADATVALCLQSVVNRAKSFAPVRATPTSIVFYQKTNLFNYEPTPSQAVCIVRSVATRQFGLNNKNRKEPFEREKVVKIAKAYGVWHQGYCHLVVVAIQVIMLSAMCRFDDASGLIWRNIRFETDGSSFEITFDKEI